MTRFVDGSYYDAPPRNRQFLELVVLTWDGDKNLMVDVPTKGLHITLDAFGRGNPDLLKFTAGQILRGYPHTHQLDNELDIERAPGLNTMTTDHYHQIVIDIGCGRGYNFQITKVQNSSNGAIQAPELVL